MSQQQAQRFIEQATYALQQGEVSQALAFAEQACALAPSNADAHLVRGVALSQLGQAAPATEALNRAIQLAPYDTKGYYNLALHYFGLGYRNEAAQMAREALRVDRNHAGAIGLLSQIEQQPADPSQPVPPPAETLPPQDRPGPEAPYGSAPGTPYAPPPSYGYYPPPQPSGLGFVRSLGKTWDAAAWLLVASGLVFFIVMMVHGLSNQAQFQNMGFLEMLDALRADPQHNRLSWMSLGVSSVAFLWMIFDIVDKKASPIWLLPGFLCCCCNAQWLILPIYMAAGRKR